MPRRPSLSRRLTTAARWPVGIALTSWSYMWRTTPMHRREELGTAQEDGPPPLPDGVDRDEVQHADDGVGPLFHRRYSALVREPSESPEELIARVTGDLNKVAPTEFAVFQKVRGGDGPLRVGDEYVVRMPGPWDGPVRVVHKGPRSFRLATPAAHGEGGPAAHVDVVPRAGRAVGGRRPDRRDRHPHAPRRMKLERLLGFPGEPRTVADLRGRGYNFDPRRLDELVATEGWHHDDRRQALPPEPPGEPVPGGTFERAVALMRDYRFADGSAVHAIFEEDAPLQGRDMLLVARFVGLDFRLGVRVAAVVDERGEEEGRPLRTWGWSYRTLRGHLERGEMSYEVRKWLDTGEVEFRIAAVSHRARLGNPLVRLGFALLGRREQLKFYAHTCAQMARATAAAV
jgi:uncharacterized protein (UPF0548 family)